MDQGPVSLKVHQAIARALAENGVDTMFGLVGDANMFTTFSFVHDYGGTFISASNEVGGALMALGYAYLSGKVGVASVTHGPGLTNTVTALVEGVKGMVPMVLFCGDTATADRENNQNVAQREIVTATGAGFEQIRSSKTVVEDVARALRRAALERRPIALNLPYELDWQEVDYQSLVVRLPEDRAIVPTSEDFDNAVGMIASARRPLILAGRGANSSAAREAILKLARRIEAPLATTLKAKDLFLGEDFNLGIFGTVSTPACVETIVESDCIIAFGASLTYRTTSHRTFLKDKRIIQINLEPGEIGKNVAPDVGLVGDPAGMADLILHWIDEAEIPASGSYTDELRARLKADQVDLSLSIDELNGTVNYARALSKLDQMLPEDRVLVSDGGRFLLHAWSRVRAPGAKHVWLVDFGSIGLGMSSAIGASYAAEGRTVVLLTGDGGFMNGGLAEFNTAVRYGLNIIVVVCNDGSYGAEVAKFRYKHPDVEIDPNLIQFAWPELAPVARALGGTGYTVRNSRDLDNLEGELLNRKGPVLIDMKVDPYKMPMAV